MYGITTLFIAIQHKIQSESKMAIVLGNDVPMMTDGLNTTFILKTVICCL